MKIALLGDIALFGTYSVNENGTILEKLDEISEYLACFDCVVGNLETPFSIKKKTYGAKSAYICADIENIVILKKLHLNAVSLANNHMFDFGEEGLQCTLNTLDKAGVRHFGIDGEEYVFETDGNKILFTGFCCYSSNPLLVAPTYGAHGVNCYNINTVSKIISAKSKKGYLNIVSVHAGMEHVNYPHIDHIKAARKLADNSSYVYYGHHPHVIQGVESYKGSVLAYSLGNFCFDDVYTSSSRKPLVSLTENNRTGMILEFEIIDNKLIEFKETVIRIESNGCIRVQRQADKLINKYNNQLSHALLNPKYSQMRQAVITERIKNRKRQRTLGWYLKRLRPRYLKIMLNARNNSKKYFLNVRKYIK